jgi:hypothetical protein
MSEEFFDVVVFGQIVLEHWENKCMQNRPHVFVRPTYSAFSSIRIIALRSVNKIFPESYDIFMFYDIHISSQNVYYVFMFYRQGDMVLD